MLSKHTHELQHDVYIYESKFGGLSLPGLGFSPMAGNGERSILKTISQNYISCFFVENWHKMVKNVTKLHLSIFENFGGNASA